MNSNPSGPSVVLAPAAGPGVGGGHVMRCLTLAHALAEVGARCSFVAPSDGVDLINRFARGLYPVIRVGSVEAMPAIVARQRPDALVIDNYAVDAALEAGLARSVKAILAIDDLANRPHAANIVVDPGYGREPQDYRPLAPRAALLMGPTYALVAGAFAEVRGRSPRVAPGAHVDRIFVSFGLADIDGVAQRAVTLLTRLAPAARLEIAIAADAQSARPLSIEAARDIRLRVHLDARNVAELMSTCDICVGAGGSGVWERATLGKPSLAVVVADNQRELVRRLVQDGLCIGADLIDPAFEHSFERAFQTLQDPALRADMAARSQALCDGQGAPRVADALLHLVR